MPRKIAVGIACSLILTAGIVLVGSRAPFPAYENEIETEEALPEEPQANRAESIMNALAAAYPWRIEKTYWQWAAQLAVFFRIYP